MSFAQTAETFPVYFRYNQRLLLRGNEADCLIYEPGGENSPFPGTTTLADISNFCVKFGYLILGKIIKFVVTRCQILRLKCTKFDFGWGTPLGELAALLQDPQLG